MYEVRRTYIKSDEDRGRLLLLNHQNALRQAIVFSIFFCEESLVRDTNLHYKDRSEMHSGSCSQMTPSGKCAITFGHAGDVTVSSTTR